MTTRTPIDPYRSNTRCPVCRNAQRLPCARCGALHDIPFLLVTRCHECEASFRAASARRNKAFAVALALLFAAWLALAIAQVAWPLALGCWGACLLVAVSAAWTEEDARHRFLAQSFREPRR